MRLTYVIELVLAVAVGLALTRVRMSDPRMGDTRTVLDTDTGRLVEQKAPRLPRITAATESVLYGVAFVGGFMTWVERARGRSPLPWGPGRWAWSVLFLLVIISLSWIVIDHHAMLAITQFEVSLPANLKERHASNFLENSTRFLLAIGPTYFAGGAHPPSARDSREMAGRLLAVSIVTLGITIQLLRLTGTPMYGDGGGMH